MLGGNAFGWAYPAEGGLAAQAAVAEESQTVKRVRRPRAIGLAPPAPSRLFVGLGEFAILVAVGEMTHYARRAFRGGATVRYVDPDGRMYFEEDADQAAFAALVSLLH